MKTDGGLQVLRTKQLGTLFVDRVSVLSVSKLDTIGSAFETLSSHRISSVPVCSVHKRTFTHFIDIVDIVAYVVQELGHPEQGMPLTKIPTVAKLPDFTVNAVNWAHAHVKVPYEPMDDKASVSHALEWMKKTGAARIPVIDSAGELQTIVTESGILKFLAANIDQFPQRTQSLQQLSLATSQFNSIQNTARAIDAFRLIAKNRVGAVAVLNDSREIVGNISATDLRVINSTGGYAPTLFLPANLFVRLRDDPASATALPVVATPESTLEEVITKFITYKCVPPLLLLQETQLVLCRIHQIYVTKSGSGQTGEVCGMVDLKSVLQVLNFLP